MKILVSACLLGIPCRWDGRCKTNEAVLALAKEHTLIPFCPEIYGGLPTPRGPSEIVGDRVFAKSGLDEAAEFKKGAQAALDTARMLGCDCAILQDRSPSCGVGVIHNGLFDGGLVEGNGITADLLLKNGLRVYPASDVKI